MVNHAKINLHIQTEKKTGCFLCTNIFANLMPAMTQKDRLHFYKPICNHSYTFLCLY